MEEGGAGVPSVASGGGGSSLPTVPALQTSMRVGASCSTCHAPDASTTPPDVTSICISASAASGEPAARSERATSKNPAGGMGAERGVGRDAGEGGVGDAGAQAGRQDGRAPPLVPPLPLDLVGCVPRRGRCLGAARDHRSQSARAAGSHAPCSTRNEVWPCISCSNTSIIALLSAVCGTPAMAFSMVVRCTTAGTRSSGRRCSSRSASSDASSNGGAINARGRERATRARCVATARACSVRLLVWVPLMMISAGGMHADAAPTASAVPGCMFPGAPWRSREGDQVFTTAKSA